MIARDTGWRRGFILLNESLGWPHLLAAALIITGVLMARKAAPVTSSHQKI